jgi:hypothetical protein
MENKTPTALEALFKSFCNKDIKYKPEYMNPVLRDGIVYAADLHRMIFCEQSKLDFQVENPNFDVYNFQAEVPKPSMDKVFHLTEEMFEPFNKDEMEWKGKDIECKECEGSGTVVWEYDGKTKSYDEEFDCPVCLGTGYSRRRMQEPTGKKTVGHNDFVINGIPFNMQFIYSLLEVQKVLGEIRIVSLKDDRVIFKAGDCSIMIMARSRREYNEDPCIEVSV